MKEWNLTISTVNDTAKLTVNNVVKELKLYTSDGEKYCLDIHSTFPSEAGCVLFSVKTLSKSEKVKAAEHLHRQYCHQTFNFLINVLSASDEKDTKFFRNSWRIFKNGIVYKIYKPTIPKPAVENLFNPDKMKFKNIVSNKFKAT